MGIYVSEQTGAFFHACLLGCGLGLLYDVFRIVRMAFPAAHSNRQWGYALAFAEDILFFSLCAGATFLFMMGKVHGQLRFFLLSGEILGAVLWHYTVGHLLMKIAYGLITVVKGLASFVFRFFVRPLWRVLYRIVYVMCLPLRFLARIVKKTAIKANFHLKTRAILLYNNRVSRMPQQNPAKETEEPKK